MYISTRFATAAPCHIQLMIVDLADKINTRMIEIDDQNVFTRPKKYILTPMFIGSW